MAMASGTVLATGAGVRVGAFKAGAIVADHSTVPRYTAPRLPDPRHTHTDRMSIRRHTAYNLLGQLAPLAAALATIPVFLRLIGEQRYGALAIIWLMVGYFGLFDLGLGRAAAQRLSKMTVDQPAERSKVFWTAVHTSVAIGLAGGLFAWLVAHLFFSRQLSIDAVLRLELIAALPWIALIVPIAALSGVLMGSLQAQQRFLALNVISSFGHVALQLAPLAAAIWISPSLAVLVPATVLARAAALLVLFGCCGQRLSSSGVTTWDRGTARQLLGYGGWITVSAVVGPLMVVLDRLIIGAVFGPKAVTHYAIPFQLAERATILSAALNQALFPRLAAAASQSDRQALAADGFRALAVVMSPLIATCMLLIGPFLNAWISAEMATASTRIGQILFFGFWINSLALVPYTQLQAAGRPDVVARCHLAELLPYLALLYVALKSWGLVGAAAVFALRAAVDLLLLAHCAGVLGQYLRMLVVPTALLLLVFAAASPGWLTLAWQGLTGSTLLLLLLAWSVTHAPAGWRLPRASWPY